MAITGMVRIRDLFSINHLASMVPAENKVVEE